MHPNERYTIIKTTTKEIIINPEQTRHIIKHKTCLKGGPRFTDRVHKCTEACYLQQSNIQILSERLTPTRINLFQKRNILLLALLSY